MAAADAIESAPDRKTRLTTRCLSLHNLPDPKTKDRWQQVINGHLQILSTSSAIRLPRRVGDLLVIDTLDYGVTFAQQWERLGKQEPYWHGDTLQPTNGFRDQEFGFYFDPAGNRFTEPGPGRVFRATEVRKVPTEEPGQTVHGLIYRTPEGKAALEKIAILTTGTDVPVVTAEWFFAQTATQFGRDPGFYDFCGIKTLADFERLVGYTKKEIDPSFLEELRAAVSQSTVTKKEVARRIIRRRSAGGGYWLTQDANFRVAGFNLKADPLTNLGDDYVFQAIETYGFRANGFLLTGLFNAKGERQDVAPDSIARDSTDPDDGRVLENISCYRCHTTGFQDVKDWVRNVSNKTPNYLTDKDPDKLRALRQQYVESYLEPGLKEDRLRYAEALFQATKMKPAEFSALYAEAWQTQVEERVTLARASRDLGFTAEEIQAYLARADKKVDPILAAFRLPNPETIPVVRWYAAYHRAADAMYGVTRPFSIKEKKE